MRRPRPHIGNHPGVRSGVFYVLLLLCLMQGIKWGIPRLADQGRPESANYLDTLAQKRLDEIRMSQQVAVAWTLRPFNPNFLDDYKGYLLGIPHRALDSLYAYRTRGGTLRNIADFQRVSGLPDSLCAKWEPFFFYSSGPSRKALNTPSPTLKVDLNTVTASELQAIRGIGPVLSERIIRFREALGGFLHPDQLLDVYGLPPEVARRAARSFPLKVTPEVPKIDINKASAARLASLVYITREMAEELVAVRDRLGPYQNPEDLKAVSSIPEDRIERIALYLQF